MEIREIAYLSDEYTVLKKLGKGKCGTVYDVIRLSDNKRYALKSQKVSKDALSNQGNTKHKIWREIHVYNWINTLSEQDQCFFPKMYDCTFHKEVVVTGKSKRKSRASEAKGQISRKNHRQRRLLNYSLAFEDQDQENKDETQECSTEYYVNFLLDMKEKDFDSFVFSHLKESEMISIIIQYCYIVYLLRKKGYSHNDVHTSNIMYKRVEKDRKLTISIDAKKYTFKSKGYLISLIDFDRVTHDSFDLDSKYRNKHKKNFISNDDFTAFFSDFVCDDEALSVRLEKDKDRPLYEDVILSEIKSLVEYEFLTIQKIWLSMYRSQMEKEGVLANSHNFSTDFQETPFKYAYVEDIVQLFKIRNKSFYCRSIEMTRGYIIKNTIPDRLAEYIKVNMFDLQNVIPILIKMYEENKKSNDFIFI